MSHVAKKLSFETNRTVETQKLLEVCSFGLGNYGTVLSYS